VAKATQVFDLTGHPDFQAMFVQSLAF
jgi:hypothetical protein